MPSSAVMVGVPSLAFATFSLLALATWHQRRQALFLVLSGALLGLSVQTKIFTGFLAPVFLAGLLIGEYARRRPSGLNLRSLLTPAVIWGAAFGSVVIGLGLLWVGPAHLGELSERPVAARPGADCPLGA